MKDKVLELMKSSNHCVLSTVNQDGKPQSALVGFSEDDDLGLVIGTYKDSRKFTNLSANSSVSVVVADENHKLEVQYEGRAELKTVDELGDRLRSHFDKLPAAERRLNDPDQVWFYVSPSWIRFVDASQSPIKFEEMSF